MLTAKEARELVEENKRLREEERFKKIEDAIIKAIKNDEKFIEVQLKEQFFEGINFCYYCTKEFLDNLETLGYKIEGPVKMIHENSVKQYYINTFVTNPAKVSIMCYRVVW